MKRTTMSSLVSLSFALTGESPNLCLAAVSISIATCHHYEVGREVGTLVQHL